MDEMKRVNGVVELADFNVSSTRGFVPDEDPLLRLPEYFLPWEEVCDIIPRLLKEGTTRSVIDQLPLLDHDKLSTVREWYRAHLVLAVLSHSYVWCRGEQDAVKILPKCLAVPWYAASKKIGIPPVIVMYTLVLYNWKIVDPNRPLSMDNIEVLNTFTGSKSEEGFIKVNLQVEIAFGQGAAIIVEGQKAVVDQNVAGLKEALINLRQMISNLTSSLQKVYAVKFDKNTKEVCDPKFFYGELKTFFSGWQENSPSTSLTGLVFEGVSPVPIQCSSANASESSIFQTIDAFLGVQHLASPGYEEKTRLYMPPKHRAFIGAVKDGPRIRDFVLESKDQVLVEKYNECIEALKCFRTAHVSIVTKYMVIQANKDPSKPKESSEKAGLAGVVMFLKKIRDESKDMFITNEK